MSGPAEPKAAPSSDRPRINLSSRSLLWRLLLVMAISAGSLVLLLVWTGSTDLLGQLGQVQFGWFLLAALVSAFTWVLDALANWFLLRGIGWRLPFGWTLLANLSANFVSYLTPFLAGGPPLFMFLLSRKGVSVGASATVVTARLTVSAIVFSVLFPLFLAFFSRSVSWSETWRRILGIPLILLGVVAVLVLLFAIWRRRPGSYQRLVQAWPLRVWLCGVRFARFWAWLLGELRKMGQSARTLVTLGWVNLLWTVLAIVFYWAAFYSVAPLLAYALGYNLDFLATFLGQAVLNALVSLSPTPGGSGAAELGFATLFASWIPAAALGIFTALWRLLIYYLTLLGGGIALVVMLHREKIFGLLQSRRSSAALPPEK